MFEQLLVALIGYYLWGNDGFLPETHTACQTAKEQLKVCLERGEEDARRGITDEVSNIINQSSRR